MSSSFAGDHIKVGACVSYFVRRSIDFAPLCGIPLINVGRVSRGQIRCLFYSSIAMPLVSDGLICGLTLRVCRIS